MRTLSYRYIATCLHIPPTHIYTHTFLTGPEKTSDLIDLIYIYTPNTSIYITVPNLVSYSVSAMQNLFGLLDSRWIAAWLY